MDSAAAVAHSRQSHQQRPTQAYYVPRKLLENGRGPTATSGDGSDSDKSNTAANDRSNVKNEKQRRKSSVDNVHKSNNKAPYKNNENQNNYEQSRKETKDPQALYTPPIQNRSSIRPLMSAPISWPTSQQEKPRRPINSPNNYHPQPKFTQSPIYSPIKSHHISAVPQQIVQQQPPAKPQSLPITQSQPRTIVQKQPLVRPNPFCPLPQPTERVCLCDRPESHIVCKRCGYECRGRVQIVCQVHPTKLFLTDLRQCPEPLCKSTQILERYFDLSVEASAEETIAQSNTLPLAEELDKQLSLNGDKQQNAIENNDTSGNSN